MHVRQFRLPWCIRWLPILLPLWGMMPARAACLVQPAAVVPLRIIGQSPLVTVEVNGQAATFILDTGAERSVVSEAAVRRLGLARDVWVGTTMGGVGGVESRPNADPRSLTLGGVTLQRRTLSRDTSLTVGILPQSQIGGEVIDGLLGRDFLSLFDLDLDMPDAKVSLYRVAGCAGRFLPWRQRYDSLAVTMLARQAILVPVVLNGVMLRALLDTGASGSLLGATGLYRMGLNVAALAADPEVTVSGLGPHRVIMRQHRFETLQVGQQVLQSPVLWAAPLRLGPPADLLLGTDYLLTRRLWISFATGQVFVAGSPGPD